MKKIYLLLSIALISCGEPVAITKCKSLINKKVLLGEDTLVIINYTYSTALLDGNEDEFIISNGVRIRYNDIDKFLIK